MSRKTGKKSGNCPSPRLSGHSCAHIVGIGNRKARLSDGRRTIPGMPIVVSIKPSSAELAHFNLVCRRNGLAVAPIGEPLSVRDGAKPRYLAYRVVGNPAGLAELLNSGCLLDAQCDAPTRVTGERVAMPIASNGYVDQRRQPAIPREAQRVLRPAVADIGMPARPDAVADMPIGPDSPETYGRNVTHRPARRGPSTAFAGAGYVSTQQYRDRAYREFRDDETDEFRSRQWRKRHMK